MEHDVILLGVKPYDFTDGNGKRVSGASAWVAPLKSTGNVQGLIPVKYSVSQEQAQALVQQTLPATATLHLDFDLATSKAKFSGFSNLSPVDLVI